mmetsp:Transcript_29327/g.60101  ORF Transcript_29327/g.60101 Transcript_29327/m.60101 type:complete len:96 (-) Transcript_29327:69-356(-)
MRSPLSRWMTIEELPDAKDEEDEKKSNLLPMKEMLLLEDKGKKIEVKDLLNMLKTMIEEDEEEKKKKGKVYVDDDNGDVDEDGDEDEIYEYPNDN